MPGRVVQKMRPLAWLALPYLCLTAIGFLILGGASSARGLVPGHAVGAAVGLGVGAACARVELARLRRLVPIVFLVTLGATALVFVPGVGLRIGGAQRSLGLGPLVVEPSVAMALLAALVGALHRGFGALALAASAALLALEPDYSTLGVLIVAAALVAGASGAGWRRSIAVGALLLTAALWVAAHQPYVLGRVQGFLHPDASRLGAGFEPLRLDRALAARRLGGVGLGRGMGRLLLGAAYRDYMFALVLEELGIAVALALVFAYGVLAWRGALAIRAAADPFERGIAAGCTAFLVAPAALHIAVCLRLVPITSVHLPFVGYGASETVASAIALGLLAALARPPRSSAGAAPGEKQEASEQT